MARLLLLRHGTAGNKRPRQTDRDRCLTLQGRGEAAWVGDRLRENGMKPDLILVSPACRTLETLEALRLEAITIDIRTVESLYLATARDLAAQIAEQAQSAQVVLVIGHNPGLQELACLLAGAQAQSLVAAQFPPACLAEYDVSTPWATLAQGHGARLANFMIPLQGA